MEIKRDSSKEENREPTHPGEVVEDYMNHDEITQKDLADRMNISRNRLNKIINKKRGISADTAHRLARVFDTTPGFWKNLDSEWKLWKVKQEQGDDFDDIEPIQKAV